MIDTQLHIAQVRSQFPILSREVNGFPLAYFDNAATTQKPQRVIDALVNYYSHYNANIHRGVHSLAEEATEAYEGVRQQVADFIGANEKEEIIFTSGTTDGMNLLSHGLSAKLQPGDEVLVSTLEHHSNIVPWQMACQRTGAVLKVIPITADGRWQVEQLPQVISNRTKVIAVNYVSNALGTINPIQELIALGHAVGATVVIDAAQAAPHMAIDVQALDVDLLSFSGHKMYGPTGVGVVYGKRRLLESMPPYQGGGEMIDQVSFSGTTYNDIPYKFEAGTPNIADVIALGEAIRFLEELGLEQVAAHEEELTTYAQDQLMAIPGFRLVGPATGKVGVISFLMGDSHPFDLGQLLDAVGIAVRTGHHCAQPLMEYLDIEGTVRASFAVYNTPEEVDRLVKGVARWAKMKKY